MPWKHVNVTLTLHSLTSIIVTCELSMLSLCFIGLMSENIYVKKKREIQIVTLTVVNGLTILNSVDFFWLAS